MKFRKLHKRVKYFARQNKKLGMSIRDAIDRARLDAFEKTNLIFHATIKVHNPLTIDEEQSLRNVIQGIFIKPSLTE